MNVFLIPYNWTRHIQMGLWCGVVGTFFWMAWMSSLLLFGLSVSPVLDGFTIVFLLALTGALGIRTGEAGLLRWTLRRRILSIALTTAFTFAWALLIYWLWSLIALGLFDELGRDPHVAALRYRLGDFMAAGLICSLSHISSVRWSSRAEMVSKESLKRVVGIALLAGLFASVTASAGWSLANYWISQHYYWSGLMMFALFGFAWGLGLWTVPDELYTGWIRVLSRDRFGHRVPVDADKSVFKERFVGSYVNGLDLHLPYTTSSGSEGVQQLHISVLRDPQNQYYVRGLAQEHTKMQRFLEWALLSYNPSSPVPKEIRLSNGDRLELGPQTEVEFVVIPREER